MNRNYLDNIASFFQSFYAEFFGTFIPGFIAVVSVSSLCLISSIYLGLIRGISGVQQFVALLFTSGNSIKLLSSWAVLGVVCAFSYAVGAIIYRRAPKVPDAIASYRQWRGTAETERKSLAVDFSRLTCDKHPRIGVAGWPFWKGEAVRAKFGSAMDYPYPHLRQFLAARGHFDLLKYVPWCGDYGIPGKVGKRSKTQINIIKQRIISMGNNSLSRDLIRNESHIRLLNSLWYIFRFLQEISLFFILIQLYLVLSYMFHIVVDNGGISITISLVEVEKYCSPVPLIVFMIAFFTVWFLKRNIVKCFHYVRTRELVMVLNAAETVRRASTNKKDLLFFHGMRKCNKEFIKTFCRGCPNETLCGR